MIKKSAIEKIVFKLKESAKRESKYGRYNNTLKLVSVCANLLYESNLYYADYELELILESLIKNIKIDLNNVRTTDSIIVFYDGFGLNDRGLAQIYIKALSCLKKVVYITYKDRENMIPDIIKILDNSGGEYKFIDREKKSEIEQIQQLADLFKEYPGSKVFYYSTPDDAVAVSFLYGLDRICQRIQINLTDHAFWLGAGCIDKCIEFRKYGAQISYEYRKIEKEKIVVIPFYPCIHYDRKFLGYPFEVNEDQKVIFSGGALYKTLGGDGKYYETIDYILKKHKECIFWYAGSGNDTYLRTIMERYPDRVFYTAERADLFQVLEHCYFYLSTYPICGGLMFQYACMAGKVPVTLKNGMISDDFLLNQCELEIEFCNIQDMYDEIDRLIEDKEYYNSKCKKMKAAVISKQQFDDEVKKVIDQKSGSTPIEYHHIDTTEFQKNYLQKMTDIDVFRAIAKRKVLIPAMRYYPIMYIKGIISTLCGRK